MKILFVSKCVVRKSIISCLSTSSLLSLSISLNTSSKASVENSFFYFNYLRESIKKDLNSAFDVLVTKIEDYKAASKSSGEKEEKLRTDYTESGKVVHKLKLQLESINISNQEKSRPVPEVNNSAASFN